MFQSILERHYAKWTKIVHFVPHSNSKTTEPIFTFFLHDIEQLVELLG